MKERIKQGIRKILKENIDVSEHEDYTDYEQLILSIGSYMERNSIKTKTKMMNREKYNFNVGLGFGITIGIILTLGIIYLT